MLRFALIIGVVIGVPAAFISTLCREIGQAFWSAWNASQQEVEAFRTIWRSGELPTDELP